MLNGDPNNFARQFDVAHQDYFKLTIHGRDALGAVTGAVDFFLADYRVPTAVAQPYVISQWTTVNLSSLGNAASLTFTLDSTDVGPFGINTPTYFAMDNLTVTPVPEPGALALAGLAILIGWTRNGASGGACPRRAFRTAGTSPAARRDCDNVPA
jgi:hypothetical protein